ncbi:MAG: cyclic lactone autoinducer peptide [Firmicutes bacterium]|nr:cyclic lactone autoinducer peptide [Bacillota bacterium]
MKKLGTFLVVNLCAVLSLFFLCSACGVFFYQPELPQKSSR